MQQDQTATGTAGDGVGAPNRNDLRREVARLRRTDNRGEVTLDTRMRHDESVGPEPEADVDNYMIRKARKIGEDLPEGDLRRRLHDAADAYRAILSAESCDPTEVDRIEDDLLERLEEAEEAMAAT